jgi:hypothetical protein
MADNLIAKRDHYIENLPQRRKDFVTAGSTR